MSQYSGFDDSARLQDLVQTALKRGERLRILGQGTKSHLLPSADPGVQLLSVAEHQGIEHYAPEELVITVRAGTPIIEVERLLARQRQMLAFEPPRLKGGGTIGGAVAAGLAGPGQPWRGGVRDSVLGVELLNGLGERLRFGGQVMKNVAGYDLSRLQVGACGHFGVLLAISLRVAPMPLVEKTYRLEAGDDIYAQLKRFAIGQLPVTGLAVAPNLVRQGATELVIRLAGSARAIAASAVAIGGSELAFAEDYWQAMRDQEHGVFHDPDTTSNEDRLYRAALPLGAGALALDETDQASVPGLIEWGGAQRWLRSGLPSAELAARVALLGGHLQPYSTLADGVDRRGQGLDPLQGSTLHQRELLKRLRAAFDPSGIFSPVVVPISSATPTVTKT